MNSTLINLEGELQKFIRAPDRIHLQNINHMWKFYEAFADKDFVTEILEGLRLFFEGRESGGDLNAGMSKVHQRFWEMYCSVSMMESEFELLPPVKKAGGPDILFEIDGQRVWIECVCPTKGTGNNEVPSILSKGKRVSTGTVPWPEMALRYTSSIRSKLNALQSVYQKKDNPIVGENDVYIIAVNGTDVNEASPDYPGFPGAFVSSLYGLGPPAVTYNLESSNFEGEPFLTSKDSAKNASGIDIDHNLFLLEEFKGVSGVFFSRTNFANIPSVLRSGMYYVPNIHASNPAPDEIYKNFDHWGIQLNAAGEISLEKHEHNRKL